MSEKLHGPYPHGRRWRVQVRVGNERRHKSFANYTDAVDFMSAGGADLAAVSASLLRRASSAKSSRDGWIYAIATSPSVVRRLKIGFTNDIRRRFREHRTTNPTALLIAAWEASRNDEITAHRALRGRIGLSEMFVVPNLEQALSKLDGILGARLRPASTHNGAPVKLVTKAFAVARQRTPKPNGKPAVADLVIADVRARQELGQKRYGTDLQPNNGRDALVDAYQEAIDLAMYLRQLIEERAPNIDATTAPRAQGDERCETG